LSTNNLELTALQQTYGPDRNSESGEEWIVRDYFKDKRDGVFLDVGANHYQTQSNTYYLETTLNWSGVAIEPQEKFAADYAQHRPRTHFVPLFAARQANQRALLYIPDNDLIASSNKEFAAIGGAEVSTVQARTTTIDAILEHYGITHLDFMTMDIELAEPDALSGFTPERVELQLAAVEAHEAVRQQIIDYFTKRGFVVLGKYLRADSRNLWFAPLQPIATR